MDSIPPEILCNIFLAALPHPTDRREYLSSVAAPLRISHVCRSWRTLSLSFGELWSYLCIKFPTRKRDPKAISVFDTWIERTNEAPLNFRVECHCSSLFPAVYRDAKHIITAMISQQHRWKDITLTVSGAQLSPEFSGLNLINMPILTSLALRVVLPLLVKISIAQSSRLRRIYVYAGDFELITGEGSLRSFTESAEISFGYGDVSGIHALRMWLNVLKAAPFLTEFIADSQRYMDLPQHRAQNEPLIRLPDLRVLKLQVGSASFIIDYVTLPNLQVLFFTSNTTDEELEAEMLTSFIRRSLPPLTTLEWEYAHEDLIISILRLFPTLKYLRLSWAKVTRRFFHELAIPSNIDADSLPGDEYVIVCPLLETLFLQWVRFEDDADWWVAFIAMLKSRPRGLGKSDVIHLGDGIRARKPVEVSDLDENIGDSRREVNNYIQECGVVIGNHKVFEFRLTGWQVI